MKGLVASARNALAEVVSTDAERKSPPPSSEDAVTALYRRHAGAVAARLTRLCGDHELALDLTHDAFVVALRRLDEGVTLEPDAEAAWVHAIGFNLLRDHRRGRARRRGLLDRLLGRSTTATTAAGEGPDLVASLAGQLDAALGQLNDDQRDAFVLRAVEGLSLEDAAHVLGTTIQTVSYRAKKAEAMVRAHFDEGTPS